MTIVWPPSLDRSLQVADLKESPAALLLRTSMQSGPAKARRLGTAGARPIAGSIILSRSQLETFDEFYTDTTESGALSWEWTHPRTGATRVFRFTKEPVYEPLTMRTDNAARDRWRVVLDLEILPDPASVDPPPEPPANPIGGGGSPLFLVSGGPPERTEAPEEPASIIEGPYYEADSPPAAVVVPPLYYEVWPTEDDKRRSAASAEVDDAATSTKDAGPPASVIEIPSES